MKEKEDLLEQIKDLLDNEGGKNEKPITISIKSDKTGLDERERVESVCCLIKEEDRINIITTGEFSIDDMLQYVAALNKVKERILKEVSNKLGISMQKILDEQIEGDESGN